MTQPQIIFLYNSLVPLFNERLRRLFAAMLAQSFGRGGICTVSEATGVARGTISRGLRELEPISGGAKPGNHVRRPVGRRKRATETDPTLLEDLRTGNGERSAGQSEVRQSQVRSESLISIAHFHVSRSIAGDGCGPLAQHFPVLQRSCAAGGAPPILNVVDLRRVTYGGRGTSREDCEIVSELMSANGRQAAPCVRNDGPASVASDPGRDYRATLAGASAMWSEMQTLLDHGIAGLEPGDIRRLVIDENILAKRTLVNRQKVWKKLTERYSLTPQEPRFRDFLAHYYREPSAGQRGLLGYLLLCANDRVVRRLGAEWLAPKLSRAGTPLRIEDLKSHFPALVREAPAIARWTPTTRLRVFQHYLGAVRDFGFAQGTLKKRTLRPHVGSRALVYAIQLAQMEGLAPLGVLESDWMRLLGIDLDTAITRMYQLNAEGLARFRMAGAVVELSLTPPDEVPA